MLLYCCSSYSDVTLAAVVGLESSNVTLACKDKSIKGAHHLPEAHKH